MLKGTLAAAAAAGVAYFLNARASAVGFCS